MSAAKHTPGPCDEGCNGRTRAGLDSCCCAYSAGLRAAAPDLLAERDALIDLIRSLLKSYDAGLGVTLPKLWLADARAAIARAEGRAP